MLSILTGFAVGWGIVLGLSLLMSYPMGYAFVVFPKLSSIFPLLFAAPSGIAYAIGGYIAALLANRAKLLHAVLCTLPIPIFDISFTISTGKGSQESIIGQLLPSFFILAGGVLGGYVRIRREQSIHA